MRARFNELSIRTKMFLVLGVGLLGFVIYFGINQFILNAQSRILAQVVQRHLPAMELADSAANNLARVREAANQATLTQDFEALGQMDKGNQAVVLNFTRWIEGKLPYFEKAQNLKSGYMGSYRQLNEMIQNIVSGLTPLSSIKDKFQSEISNLARIERQLTDLRQDLNNALQSDMVKSETLTTRARLIGFFILVCGLVTLAVFYLVMINVTQSLNTANGRLQSMAKRLLNMVNEAQVSSAHLKETAYRQSSSSTQTAASMDQMRELLSQTSESSAQAVRQSQASYQDAADGKALIQNLRDAMAEIERSNTELEAVSQVVKMIHDRTTVINEIVFKTQLLSFNANIEAARAGQHGLGFAVVATEIGNLAEMSGKAAQQINELLDRSARTVDSTVTRTKEKIGKGNELSSRAYEFFKVLTDRSGQLKEFVDSISSAAAEQNSGVANVVNAMTSLNQTAAESDRMAKRISTLADTLKTEAEGLASAVEELNNLVHGGLNKPTAEWNEDIVSFRKSA